MRVAISAPSLNRDGGSERMSALLANGLAAGGHDVALIARYVSSFDRQPLDARIRVREMYAPGGPKPLRNVQLPLVVSSLRRALEDLSPDVVIGSRWDCAILSLLATRRSGIPVVAWEHGYLPYATLTAPWRALRHLTYRRAASIVVINEASRPAAERLADPSRVHLIHHWLLPRREPPQESSRWSDVEAHGVQQHKLLTLGRLEPEKGHDLLVESFALLAADVPDWTLLIVGRGSMRETLQQRIFELGLADRVFILDPIADPTATLADSDVFVLPSRHEGFGLALAEAMAEGVPAVAFDCPAGPGEIIRDGIDGLLVTNGDVRALADALHRLLSDPVLRKTLAANAVDVLDRFSSERGVERWTALLRSVAKGSAAAG